MILFQDSLAGHLLKVECYLRAKEIVERRYFLFGFPLLAAVETVVAGAFADNLAVTFLALGVGFGHRSFSLYFFIAVLIPDAELHLGVLEAVGLPFDDL